ncbi:reverse transcriptase [Gossypium australe]|uniref:Reverse transcriptase n=1 Tax=Gossypium australe TaxID=47621 RepID=A0A5B6UYZ9_9ROSI|nr:reverse transcriptase [Gossypium australe]
MCCFWWQKSSTRQGIHWCKWSDLCTPKNLGGLGFHDLCKFNVALLAKQGWRLLTNFASLLARIYSAKYFPNMSFWNASLLTIDITIWALWYARNRHVMEGKQQHALEISAKIISLVCELKELRAKLPEARITMKQSRTPSPTDPMLKLNFDTSFHAQSRQSSSGFVVRNAQGQVLGSGMVQNNFVSDPFMGEMLACLDGLRFATDMGFQNLVVEGDSRSTIVRITEMGRDRSAFGVYVEEIKQRVKMFDKIIFRSVDRNTNQVAHILAKARSTFNEDRFWVEDVPDMAVLAVKADCPIPVAPD